MNKEKGKGLRDARAAADKVRYETINAADKAHDEMATAPGDE